MIGKIIGNYEIMAELAQGGMGAVYRARHATLPREVVVKSILLASFPLSSQEPLKARFLREAFVQSQLDHPNIVRVYEFFTTAENYFLVMEYVAGMSLRELMRRQGAMAPEQALPLFKQALSALDYAHNFSYVDETGGRHTGIAHRDIKPGNLLLDGMARLKLTDFGIVKLAGERALTRTGFNPGTAEYMSPEQIRGEEVDARSDLYSLGVTFYEMLAGRLPFPHAETGSEYEMMRRHVELTPPPLSEVAPGLPAALAAVVMRSLEKDVNARYQSAAAFLDALHAYERRGATAPQVAAQPITAPRPQVTHSMTELLDAPAPDYATNVATETTRPRGVAPAPPPSAPATNVMPRDPGPVPPPARIPGAAPTPRRGAPVAAIVLLALLALGALGATAFYLLRPGAPVGSPPPIAAASPVAAPADDRQETALQPARAAEAQENYREAVQLYEAYLAVNPQAADAAALRTRIALLKRVQGLLTAAELELGQDDLPAAARDFTEALQLLPDSRRAREGLTQTEKKER
ncbi:MAG: serine/threonine-protein kinase [Blastocatellia bacterium]|nr:serine/threonine-protein kinase [Blastocatellia bacterium]